MSQNPVPLEGYVSFIPTQLPGHRQSVIDQNYGHHHSHQTAIMSGGDVVYQTQLVTNTIPQQVNYGHAYQAQQTSLVPLESVFPSNGMQSTCFQVVDQQQNLVMMAQQPQPLLVVNGVKETHHQPQQQMLLLDVVPAPRLQMQVNSASISLIQGPSTAINVIQVPSANARHQRQSDNTLDASTATYNVQLPEGVVIQSNPTQLEILQLPDNGSFVLQPQPSTLLCLSQPTQDLTSGNTFIISNGLESQEVAILGLTDSHQLLTMNPCLESQAVITTSDDDLSTLLSPSEQTSLAKSWHTDADLVNRAMTALNRSSSTTTANTLPIQDLCLTSSASL